MKNIRLIVSIFSLIAGLSLVYIVQASVGTPTATPQATGTHQALSSYIVIKSANLRAGPGTNYAVTGTAKAGDILGVLGTDGQWYKLNTGQYIFSALVKTYQSERAPVTATSKPAQATKTVPLTPAAKPTFTPTSTSTSTPVPTNTPLPPPTLKPLDALKNAIITVENTCSGGCKFSEVEFDTDGDSEGKMIVRFIDKAPGSIWSNDDFNRDTGLKIFYTLKAINELDVDYDAIAFEFGVPVIDKYGNESAELGISCLFTKETVKRINYPNIRMRYIVDLADRAYINPVLRQN